MIRKYHNHTLQTNLPHREEESQNMYSNNTIVTSVRKWTNIRNRYNQAPHLTDDTNEKVTSLQLDFTNES